MHVTRIGGPTALIEWEGWRILTDPTFDPAGGEYRAGAYSLFKTQDPAITRQGIGHIDVVLLSHDHHFDNLDTSGRAMLSDVATVLTTQAGAERLGAPVIGLAPWQAHELALPGGDTLRITATPARHGPVGGDRGPVIGFVLQRAEDPSSGAVYVSGDTVWYDGVAEIAQHFPVTVAILNMGAAHVAAAGPSHLTFTATEGVEFARAFPTAIVVPLHYEGWAHFSESRREIDDAFRANGIEARLRWLQPGTATPFVRVA